MTVADVSDLGLASHGLGSDSPNIAIDSDSANHSRAEAIVVADAHLLFTGDFRRSGLDLVISKDDRQIIIHDYFKSEKWAALASRDGAVLSPDIVQALTGEVQYAQAASGAGAGAVIGKVSKLSGLATVVRNGVSVQLNVGDDVRKGDVVQTGSSSSLGLVFIDGTVFGLAASARMVLNEMIYDPAGSTNSSLLSLVQGTITFVAGETAKRGDMRVETPAATMGIRGTAVLVEIDFVVPGAGGAPPVRVQVLAEPGGVTGSLVLYSRSSPGTVIGQVSQAGLVTSVTGSGDVSIQPAPPLSPAAQAIVEQTLREYYPNYRPTPPGSSTPPGSPNNGLQTDPINFPIELPAILPLRVDLRVPGLPTDDFIPFSVTRINTPPNVNVSDVVVVIDNVGDSSTFNIADRVSIVDPDVDSAFHDIPVPYVAGTARLVSAAGPPVTSDSIDLARLIDIDPQTGEISYDPASFAFLAEGASAAYRIAFDSQSGPHTVPRTLTLTIVGVNDAPEITSASLAVDEGGSVVLAASHIGISDPDTTSFAFTASNLTHGQFETFSGGGWRSTTTFTSADIAAGHVRFTHDGSESAPTFSIQANDGFDVTSTFEGTIAFTTVNDPPVAVADTNWVQEDLHIRAEGNVILGANHSPDSTQGHPPSGTFADVADTDAETEPLTLNTVNGSSANVSTPIAGSYGILWLNPSGSYFYIVNNAAVQGLDAGETVTDQFTYTVTDGTATSNTSTLTITVFGSSDADNFQFAASAGHAAIGASAAVTGASGQDHIDLSGIVTASHVNERIASHVAASPTRAQDTLISNDDDQTIMPNLLAASLSGTDFIVNPTGSFN